MSTPKKWYSPCIFKLNIGHNCGFKSNKISLFWGDLSLTNLYREQILYFFSKKRHFLYELTFPNRFLNSDVQSPKVRIWTLKCSSPGAEVIENGCLMWKRFYLNTRNNHLLLIFILKLSANHSKGETSGHFTNRYIPLLYLKPGGFFICMDRTLPGYIAACMIDIWERWDAIFAPLSSNEASRFFEF